MVDGGLTRSERDELRRLREQVDGLLRLYVDPPLELRWHGDQPALTVDADAAGTCCTTTTTTSEYSGCGCGTAVVRHNGGTGNWYTLRNDCPAGCAPLYPTFCPAACRTVSVPCVKAGTPQPVPNCSTTTTTQEDGGGWWGTTGGSGGGEGGGDEGGSSGTPNNGGCGGSTALNGGCNSGCADGDVAPKRCVQVPAGGVPPAGATGPYPSAPDCFAATTTCGTCVWVSVARPGGGFAWVLEDDRCCGCGKACATPATNPGEACLYTVSPCAGYTSCTSSTTTNTSTTSEVPGGWCCFAYTNDITGVTTYSVAHCLNEGANENCDNANTVPNYGCSKSASYPTQAEALAGCGGTTTTTTATTPEPCPPCPGGGAPLEMWSPNGGSGWTLMRYDCVDNIPAPPAQSAAAWVAQYGAACPYCVECVDGATTTTTSATSSTTTNTTTTPEGGYACFEGNCFEYSGGVLPTHATLAACQAACGGTTTTTAMSSTTTATATTPSTVTTGTSATATVTATAP